MNGLYSRIPWRTAAALIATIVAGLATMATSVLPCHWGQGQALASGEGLVLNNGQQRVAIPLSVYLDASEAPETHQDAGLSYSLTLTVWLEPDPAPDAAATNLTIQVVRPAAESDDRIQVEEQIEVGPDPVVLEYSAGWFPDPYTLPGEDHLQLRLSRAYSWDPGDVRVDWEFRAVILGGSPNESCKHPEWLDLQVEVGQR